MHAAAIVVAVTLVASDAHLATAHPANKIDPMVQEAMDGLGSRRVRVLLVGTDQLLADRDAFDRFTREHEGSDRFELRGEVVEQLRTIATSQQERITDQLGSDWDWRPLWIVNAVAASLPAEVIREAATLDDVRSIHLAGILPPRLARRSAHSVLEPIVDQPFEVGARRVAWNVEELGAPEVWRELGMTGRGIVVSVFDDGLNMMHHDLRARIWRNQGEIPRNGADDDGNGYADDVHGWDFGGASPSVGAQMNARFREHGTMTSGIVAGDGTGGIITGVAPRAMVMPLITGGGVHQAALAHQYAIENGADILSMSFSLPNLGQRRGFWRLMSEHSVCAGLVLVSGAGNYRETADVPVQQRIPESIPCVISVGGVDRNRMLSRFSSMGPVEWADVRFYADHPMPEGLIKPDVAAFCGPGYPVLASGSAGYIDPNTRIAGNSFSGPQAAGVCALMLQANPELCAWRLREILEATAIDLGERGKDNQTGSGLIDAPAAVRAAIKVRSEP